VARARTRPPARGLLILLLPLSLLAATASAQQSTGQSDPFESRFQTKSSFQIKFRPIEKGGEVRLYTKNPVSYEKDVSWEGSEEVLIEYQDVKITADRAHYDFPTKTATLEGHVIIDQGPTRLSGDSAVFRLDTKTGTLQNATANLPPSYHIVAEAIDKIGEATYRVHHGLFTSCDIPKPDWSFYMSEATITLDDYARMKNVSFRAREVPLLYTPYMIWPTKEGRVSGMMVPAVGYTSRRGGYLGLSHYWVTGQSTDLTSQVDLFANGTVGVGEEFRWAPSAESAGIFRGYFVHDTDATACLDPLSGVTGDACTMGSGNAGVLGTQTENRWKLQLDHVSDDLPWGMRGVIAIRQYSDKYYLQDWERQFLYTSAREILSRAFLTKNEGVDSFNLRFEKSDTILGATVLQERMPTLEYFRRTSQIGESPIYLSAQGSISNLFINRGTGLLHGGWGRLDLFPVLSFPWKGLPWLSATTTLGGRFTGYTDSTDPAQTTFLGSSFTRTYMVAGVSLIGPSFSRIYEADIGPFGKFKHIIEPRVDYSYVSNVDDPGKIPVYDDIDTALGRNQITYALVNRLLAKSSDPKAGAASEIASFTISQSYAFERSQTIVGSGASGTLPFINEGPVQALLRFTPGTFISFDGQLSYDTRNGQLLSNTVATALNWKANYFNATWFSSHPVPVSGVAINTDQLRFGVGYDISRPFRIDTQVNWDVTQGQVLEDRSLLTYRGSCYTIFLEYRQLRVPGNNRNDVRLVVNLKDIGTLLDINGAMRPGLF
jgi:LPS-assembly protein